MVRAMADPDYRAAQDRDRYAPHVAAVNELVDELQDSGGRGWLPYVAPAHGGTEAAVLSVLRDPGPKTQAGTGSGFLCVENDDPTAEFQCRAFADAGIGLRDVTPWNAYPWYVNRKPTGAELEAGVEPLRRLVALMPHLTVVLLQGGDAADGWRRLLRHHPELAPAEGGPQVVACPHPSRQALRHSDPAVRHQREQARVEAYQQVATLIRTSLQEIDRA
jgi:hypothetical protein